MRGWEGERVNGQGGRVGGQGERVGGCGRLEVERVRGPTNVKE